MYYTEGQLNPDTLFMQPEDSLILLINPAELDRHSIKNILLSHWDVISASGYNEAARIISNGILPTLIIISYDLPGTNGVRVMQKLKGMRECKDIPFLFTSQKVSDSIEEECLLMGAADFIAKPYTCDILIQRVDKAMYFSQMESFLKRDTFNTPYAGSESRQYKGFMYQMLTSLSSTIDAKDAYTRGHSSRVAAYSALIGKEAGLNSEETDILFHSGLLHDIGKIGISDAILRKRDRLTAAEYKLIMNHPVEGYGILKDIHVMPELAQVARWHHEKYDGSGYPDHLQGEDIPFIARIVSIADAFDAMTSTRSYRKAVASKEACEEIIACRGTQFDPDLADLAIELINKGQLKGTIDAPDNLMADENSA